MQTSLPTNKQQVINLLKTHLEKIEDEIIEMQHHLEERKCRRQEVNNQLVIKEEKINQLIENQSKTLGDKVNEGLYKTLETANRMRADAEAQTRKLSQENLQLNETLISKDRQLLQNRQKVKLNTKKISALEQKKLDAQLKKYTLVDRHKQLTKNLQMMKQQLERVQKQQKQLRMHIENMKKLRLYLNKHFDASFRITQSVSKSNNSNSGNSGTSGNDNFWNYS